MRSNIYAATYTRSATSSGSIVAISSAMYGAAIAADLSTPNLNPSDSTNIELLRKLIIRSFRTLGALSYIRVPSVMSGAAIPAV